jgi:hypothetical protein
VISPYRYSLARAMALPIQTAVFRQRRTLPFRSKENVPGFGGLGSAIPIAANLGVGVGKAPRVGTGAGRVQSTRAWPRVSDGGTKGALSRLSTIPRAHAHEI